MHYSHFPPTKVGTELETRDLQLVKEREVCSLAFIGIACRLALARGPTPSGFTYEIYKSHDLKIDL